MCKESIAISVLSVLYDSDTVLEERKESVRFFSDQVPIGVRLGKRFKAVLSVL
jgi:hypothetical protein